MTEVDCIQSKCLSNADNPFQVVVADNSSKAQRLDLRYLNFTRPYKFTNFTRP